MSKNFKVRAIVTVGMFAVALVSLYVFDAIPFRILFTLFSVVAAVELCSFFSKKSQPINIVLAALEMLFLIGGVIFVAQTSVSQFWYVILGVPGYDIFAYVFGNIFGGKVFGAARPFPKISKNKTWEGTILGLITATGLVTILMAVRGAFATDYLYLLCGPLALAGDLFESHLKRTFGVKDSNEIVIKNKYCRILENLVGGNEGHGGFLDRIDSTAFTTSVLLIISLMIG
ncbi:phosphatidate cytidylyltransferase [Candidatus Saccharibacteria bacterium]|nr:phosphatidate cytidylyltransferase [Candidatus Saccharibacteria bacterium]